MISEEALDEFASKYLKKESIVAIGSDELGEKLLKKIALKSQEQELGLKIVPTSSRIATLCSSLKLEIASINEHEVDTAFEFASIVDKNYNFVKRNSNSLVRDKMIAQSAEELIIIAEEKSFVEKISGVIPFEISTFGWQRTLLQLQKLGKAKLREKNSHPFRTETGHYLADVECDEIYSLEDLEFQAKTIAGVLETGLFMEYADRIILHNDRIEVKSRIQKP